MRNSNVRDKCSRRMVSRKSACCQRAESRIKVLWAAWLCLGMLVSPLRKANALPVARLKNVRPVVEVRSENAPFRVVRARQAVGFGNVLRTGPRGKADILFSNGTQLAMRENSQIEILAPAAPGNPLVVRVFGALSEVFVRRRGNTQIQTAAAIAAARGTEFLVRLPTADSTEVTVSEGVVDFFNPQGAVVINAGEQSTATIGQRPTAPRVVDVTGLLQWTAEITGLPIDLELQTLERQGGAQSTLMVQNALALAGGNRLQEARAALEPLAQAAGRGAALPLTALGLLALQNGEVDNAMTRLQDAVARDSQLPQARALLALSQLNSNRPIEAEQSAREATRLNERSSLAQSTLAYVLFFRGNGVEAERAARRAGVLDPLSPFALLTQGRVLLSQLKTDDARQSFAQAVALVPDLPLAHIELAQADLRLGQLGPAEKTFRRALELQPASGAAKVGLGVALQRQGRAPEALALYRQVLQNEPNNAQARGNVAQLLLEEGRLDEARRELAQARRDDPDSGILYVRASEVALYQQNLTAAQEFARQAVKLLPNSAAARYQLGRVYLEQGRLLPAQQEFRQASLFDKRFAAARYALGLVRERTEGGFFSFGESAASVLGSASGALTLQNFDTPGAEDRIQGALADPTAIRVATRSFGDTQFDGAAGNNSARQGRLSYLHNRDDRRAVSGLNIEHFEDDGARAGVNFSSGRASAVYGEKHRNGKLDVFGLAQFERRERGEDVGLLSSPILAARRLRTEIPRGLVGFNWQPREDRRTRALIQVSTPEQLLGQFDNPDNLSVFNFRSANFEVRHDQQVADRHSLSAGLFAGKRRQDLQTNLFLSLLGLTFKDRSQIDLQPAGAYVRDEFRWNERLILTGEMQVQRLQLGVRQQDIAPFPGPQRQTVDNRATVGLPNLIAEYRVSPRTSMRARARKLFGSVRDFQLLTPTDVFLFSFNGLPENNFLSRGESLEFEINHTFGNASFAQLGLFEQNFDRAIVLSEDSSDAPVRSRGLRASYSGFVGRDTSFFVNLDLTAAKNRQFNDYVSGVPRISGAIGLQYLNRRGFFVQPSLFYRGSVVSIEDSFPKPVRSEPGGFALSNLRVGKRWGLRTNAFVEAANLFDKTYVARRELQPGRRIVVGVSQRF